MALLSAVLALVISAGLFVYFVRLERAGRSIGVALWLLGLLLLESTLWPDPNLLPAGLFHPDLGPTNFRLLDTVCLAAIAARLVGRPLPARLSTTALWWTAFLGWLALGAVRGVLFGNSSTEVIYHGKAILYLGVMCVVAGVPREQWRSRGVDRFLFVAGAFTGVFVVLSQAGVSIDAELPLLALNQFGNVGSDAATVATALGVLALVRALTAARGRTPLLVASVPLLVSPLVAGQRAALLGLLAGLLLLGVLLVRSGGSVRLPAGDLVVVTGLLAVLLTSPLAVSALLGRDLPLPVVATVSEAIDSRGKQLSAQGRINQWERVRPDLAARPLLGWGLGHTYSYYEPGPREFINSGLTHNIAGDLVLRTGLVGLLLFGTALTASTLDALRRSRRHVDPVLAGVAVAAVTIVASWVTKGMVESLFEKYRLAILLGFAIGMVFSLDSGDQPAEEPVALLSAPTPLRTP